MCLVIILSLPWDTKTALLQSSEKDKINRREEEEKDAYDVAKVPQAGSAVCFSIKDMKSNWGSNWSVSVRG
jgi:hypothetical protein